MKQAASAGVVVLAGLLLAGGAPDSKSDKEALQPMQSLVGEWRGVGQPKRGSSAGAWIEESQWAWRFTDNRAELAFQSPEGKFYRSGRLLPGKEPGEFQLIATLPDGKSEESFAGRLSDDGSLVVAAEKPAEGRPARITLRFVAQGDRLLILFEKRLGESDRYLRLAEVGYTRKGSDFGKGGFAGRECVVTGGAGTIAVEYQGQTYYVCCTGCRDYFNDNAEQVLAEYRQRKEQEKNKKKGE
jgi:YHS domain-containing protein